ncbi:MAG: hypothetical protein KME47_10045 [Nodosilinea sp. WJT8-NPBG4]|jgi:hypothetical protein|nr:hypothetical protein [Nodosilinea sp. WJT8-NPBG4]
MTTKKGNGSIAIWGGVFFIWVILGLIFLLNVQPWVSVARWISEDIVSLPFDNFLMSIPGVKQLVSFIWNNLVSIMAVALMAICQFFQILALGTESPEAARIIEKIFANRVRVNSSDEKEVAKRRWLAGCAYILEALVCFIEYPPYEGGISAIIADFPLLEAYYIQYGELVKFFLTMLSFEGFIWVILFFSTSKGKSTSYSD